MSAPLASSKLLFKCVPDCTYSLLQNHRHIGLLFYLRRAFLRALWEVVSWVIILSLNGMKFSSFSDWLWMIFFSFLSEKQWRQKEDEVGLKLLSEWLSLTYYSKSENTKKKKKNSVWANQSLDFKRAGSQNTGHLKRQAWCKTQCSGGGGKKAKTTGEALYGNCMLNGEKMEQEKI